MEHKKLATNHALYEEHVDVIMSIYEKDLAKAKSLKDIHNVILCDFIAQYIMAKEEIDLKEVVGTDIVLDASAYLFVREILLNPSHALEYVNPDSEIYNPRCVKLFSALGNGITTKYISKIGATHPQSAIHLVLDAVDKGEFTERRCAYIKELLTELRMYANTVCDVRAHVLSKKDLANLLTLDVDDHNYTTLMADDSMAIGTGREARFATYRLTNFIKAYAKANRFLTSIEDKGLSPLEQYILIHDYVSNNLYSYDADTTPWGIVDSRNLIGSMTTDSIVCVGYAQQMAYFCKRAGIQCEYVSSANVQDSKKDGHAYNVVHLKDKKYNIDSTYICDACWDRKVSNMDKTKSYMYAFLPIQDVQFDGHENFFSQELKDKYGQVDSQVMDLKTIRKAVTNAYQKASLNLDADANIKYTISQIKKDMPPMYYRQQSNALSRNVDALNTSENVARVLNKLGMHVSDLSYLEWRETYYTTKKRLRNIVVNTNNHLKQEVEGVVKNVVDKLRPVRLSNIHNGMQNCTKQGPDIDRIEGENSFTKR